MRVTNRGWVTWGNNNQLSCSLYLERLGPLLFLTGRYQAKGVGSPGINILAVLHGKVCEVPGPGLVPCVVSGKHWASAPMGLRANIILYEAPYSNLRHLDMWVRMMSPSRLTSTDRLLQWVHCGPVLAPHLPSLHNWLHCIQQSYKTI